MFIQTTTQHLDIKLNYHTASLQHVAAYSGCLCPHVHYSGVCVCVFACVRASINIKTYTNALNDSCNY